MKELDLTQTDGKKLLLPLEDKHNYVTHYANLQFYLKQGMKLKKVHWVLEFAQECWMKPYIEMNRIQEKPKKRLRKELLQADEQLGDRRNNGEPAEPSRH